jgi:hypothetical protein
LLPVIENAAVRGQLRGCLKLPFAAIFYAGSFDFPFDLLCVRKDSQNFSQSIPRAPV